MNDDKIRELKVDEPENVAGGSVIWGNYGSLDNHGPAASVIWGNYGWVDIGGPLKSVIWGN
jgi:hypothetical protein